ncbi:hypothetical protein LOK49_LG03G01431 [Camellia lanceoleosa]|uniref:Uncharacterized protein n=1 Tax=Camellia lanceoleosa TaxID=1840588 RepID=A0ACC0I8V6_9ERIC|nr:hypothetical protein LOK49_LG03G01431 [Camellia lanceoleosa]
MSSIYLPELSFMLHEGVSKKIPAASARAHTRIPKQSTHFQFPSEDEPILPPLKKEQPKNRWDDEDVDENDVKDSWENEEEIAPIIKDVEIM